MDSIYFLCQENLIKKLLPRKQPSIKQEKRFGAYEKNSVSTGTHLGTLNLTGASC